MRLATILAALATFRSVHAGSGANEPITPNELGLTATDCATQYCASKDSLLLWLALENTCFSDKQPYFPTDLATVSTALETDATARTLVWSFNVAGAAAGVALVAGLLVGYTAGRVFGNGSRLPPIA